MDDHFHHLAYFVHENLTHFTKNDLALSGENFVSNNIAVLRSTMLETSYL